jgi:hypothetical protein
MRICDVLIEFQRWLHPRPDVSDHFGRRAQEFSSFDRRCVVASSQDFLGIERSVRFSVRFSLYCTFIRSTDFVRLVGFIRSMPQSSRKAKPLPPFHPNKLLSTVATSLKPSLMTKEPNSLSRSKLLKLTSSNRRPSSLPLPPPLPLVPLTHRRSPSVLAPDSTAHLPELFLDVSTFAGLNPPPLLSPSIVTSPSEYLPPVVVLPTPPRPGRRRAEEVYASLSYRTTVSVSPRQPVPSKPSQTQPTPPFPPPRSASLVLPPAQASPRPLCTSPPASQTTPPLPTRPNPLPPSTPAPSLLKPLALSSPLLLPQTRPAPPSARGNTIPYSLGPPGSTL